LQTSTPDRISGATDFEAGENAAAECEVNFVFDATAHPSGRDGRRVSLRKEKNADKAIYLLI
jgi:hypothetical protein